VTAHPWLGLATSVVICFAVSAIGGMVTSPKIGDWYASLAVPPWTPPDWVFGPVWTALFLAMAIAAWLVWRQAGLRGAAWPLALFGVQLSLNLLWTLFFFGLQSPGLAFLDVIALWLAIAATLAAFWTRSRVAGLLLVPYLAWVSFAGVLNFAIWRLNP
jgi:tryptophan-rich sensory protein